MQPILDSLQSNAGVVALIGLILAVVAVLVAWRALARAGRAARPSPHAANLVDDPALDQILAAQMQRLDAMGKDVQAIGSRARAVEAQGHHAVQNIGLVRFNPFEDTGSNQSFALALLDADANGVILSSLHSRQQTRVYLKAITGGRCDSPLSAEETEALNQARAASPAG